MATGHHRAEQYRPTVPGAPAPSAADVSDISNISEVSDVSDVSEVSEVSDELDEATIETVVRGFYGRVRDDVLLGPVFSARIANWEPHLKRMCAFWSSVMLATGRYSGQPMQMHLPLPIEAMHFDRWLALFEATARERCSNAAAERLIKAAQRIAESLELGVAGAHGVMLGRNQRFVRS
jgi:hemoglobin